jgi:hypothetical protein
MPEIIPLEPSAAQMRAMADAATNFLVGFIGRLPEAAASDDTGVGSLTEPLRVGVPEEGRPFEDLLGVFADGTAKGHNTAFPRLGTLGWHSGGRRPPGRPKWIAGRARRIHVGLDQGSNRIDATSCLSSARPAFDVPGR